MLNIIIDIVYSKLLNILWYRFTSDIWESYFKGNILIPLYDILQCYRTLFNHVHLYIRISQPTCMDIFTYV